MAGAIAKLYATLGLDTRGFDSGLTKSQGKLKGFVGDFKQSAMAGFGLGGGFMAFNLASQAASAAVGYMGDAIQMASALEESQSKVNQVFTESADTINAWAVDSARSFGLTEQAALEAAGTFGNFIQALGNTEAESNTMSRALVELAADLASFNNTGIDEVILALRSGLAGEAEPMRRLGVSLSAARVEAYILSRGIAKTSSEITDAMKVAARYALIFEDTTKAQGDFDRTSDGLANTTRILEAELANLQTRIGTALLPAFTGIVTFVLDNVLPAIDSFTGALQDLEDGVTGLRDTVNQSIGRDVTNDFANFIRIGMTGGIAFVTDELGRQGFAFEDFNRNILGAKDSYDVLSSAAGLTSKALSEVSDTVVDAPDIAGPIEAEMAAARKAILDGFGSIKDALKKGSRPQLISRSDRISNMETRQGKINKQLNRAVAADDPFNIRYWASAAAKQQVQLDNLKSGTGTKLRDVKSKYSAAGIDIERIWGRTGNAIERESQASADAAIAAAQSIKTGIDAIDLTASGAGLMAEFAAGIRSNIAAVSAAASLAATAANPRASVVPPAASAGGGGTGGGGHTTYVVGTLIADDKGIDELDKRITRRRRMRDRGPMRYSDHQRDD